MVEKKYKIGYTQGTFDLFHIGHLNLLKHAKDYCDILIVGVNADELVQEYKHKTPIINQNERAEILQAIRYVDNVVICHTLKKTEMHSWLHFDAIFIGDDWKGNERWDETERNLKMVGADVVYLSYTKGVSSTMIREEIDNRDDQKYQLGGGKINAIGYTTGVYDLFHIGHLNILKRAKELCDFLIVGVTTDSLCEQRKHKTPIYNQDDRMAIIGAIRYVDKVVPQVDMDKLNAVKNYNANIVFVGSDWKGSEAWNNYEKEFAEVGCNVIYLDHTDGISSSIIRNRIEN